MGDPRKQRKKFSKPLHPWRRARIEEEKVLVEEYGLKNKKDLWKTTSKLSHFKKQAKSLITRRGLQAENEKVLFLEKLHKLSLVPEGATIDDVLSLSIKDLLERRLQTIVFRKGFAHSVKQARQFVVHGHVCVNGQKMDVPSFLVPLSLEQTIEFSPKSALSDVEHPERQVKLKPSEKEIKIKKEETEEDEEEIIGVKEKNEQS